MAAPSPASAIDQLCLQCGLCCNGVLFSDVELQPGDDAEKLRELKMPLRKPRKADGIVKFNQPCPALGPGCRCRIYADRPARCSGFDCALLLGVMAGEVETEPALKIIRATKRKADKVRRLMQEIGDQNEHLAFSVRFRRLRRRFETGDLGGLLEKSDEETLYDLFSQLTLAVHDLQVSLATSFYPA